MTTFTEQRPRRSEPTLGELFSDLSAQASVLVRQEVDLAKTELVNKVTYAGRESAYIVAGAVLGYAGLLCLLAAIILTLGVWMPLWASALIVGLIVTAVAGVLAAKGYVALKQMDPVPTHTIASLQEDKEWLSQQIN